MIKAASASTPPPPPPLPLLSRSAQRALVFATLLLTAYGLGVVLLWQQQQQEERREASGGVTSEVVFWSAWITMAATGLGVVPFAFVRQGMSPEWMAGMNAIAAGMMLSASVGLIQEGLMDDDAQLDSSPLFRVLIGLAMGVGFIFLAKRSMDGQDDLAMLDLRGMDAKRALLLMTVMTLHSLSEGVGIGVSYNHSTLGRFVSLTMAVHNIPEGVAIALVMIPKGVSKTTCALYCFLSSLPQPIMAVPAFLFVEAFRPLFGIGLGFAAGAMCFVAVFDLLHEACEVLAAPRALAVTTLSALGMLAVQIAMK